MSPELADPLRLYIASYVEYVLSGSYQQGTDLRNGVVASLQDAMLRGPQDHVQPGGADDLVGRMNV